LRDLLELTLEGARGALRLRVEGRSTARGTPKWIAVASDFQIVGLSQGSAIVELEARPISDAAPDRFGEEDPTVPLDTSRSALSFFEESFAEALRGKEDADLYDRALLGTFTNFSRLFAQGGLERIEFADHNGSVPLRIDVLPDRLNEVEKLWKKTAPSQRVRVAGRLDTIRHSDRMFTLVLESGEILRGIAEPGSDDLAQYFGQVVVVTGKATFRPSGSILRIEADRLEPASGNISIWSRAPRPLLGELDRQSLLKPQSPRSGINAIIGHWPGDETEEEILEALEEIS